MILLGRIAISAAGLALWQAGAAAGAQKPSAAAEAATPGEALPADFRGRITYSGTHEGQVTTHGPLPRRLNLRSIARAAGRTREYAGAYHLVVEFNGNALSARVSGTGGILAATLSGTRNGDRCRLIDDRHGTIMEARCTAARFVGTARTQPGSRQQMTMRIDASATGMADAAQVPRQAPASGVRPASTAGQRRFTGIMPGRYSGRMQCPRGETTVRLSVRGASSDPQTGQLTVFPPNYGVSYDVAFADAGNGEILIEPAGQLETTSYIARRYNVPQFAATVRANSTGLYGRTTEPGCGPLILVAHSDAVNLSPEAFNALVERLTEEMMRPQ